MYAAVKTLVTLLSLVVFIDRLGRRKLLLASSLGCTLGLWYIGAYITAKHIDLANLPPESSTKSGAEWFAIVCVYIYAVSYPSVSPHRPVLGFGWHEMKADVMCVKASFSIAWNGVVWVYAAEIFPTRIKELAVCLTTTVQWLSQFAVSRATPYMLSSLRGGFFFFFASCLVVMGLGVWFFIPETKGKTLERMDEIFGTAYGGMVDVGEVGGHGHYLSGSEVREMAMERRGRGEPMVMAQQAGLSEGLSAGSVSDEPARGGRIGGGNQEGEKNV